MEGIMPEGQIQRNSLDRKGKTFVIRDRADPRLGQ
jgi:hypothetical protein